MQAKYYGSKDLYKYLDDIVIKSSDGTKRIIELFQEMGLYKLAETAIDQEGDVDQEYKIANLLMKYDPDNIIGWLMKWKISTIVRDISVGENIIRLAKDSEKSIYEKEVYSYFVEHGPQCNAYKKYLRAIPSDYIKSNKYIHRIC